MTTDDDAPERWNRRSVVWHDITVTPRPPKSCFGASSQRHRRLSRIRPVTTSRLRGRGSPIFLRFVFALDPHFSAAAAVAHPPNDFPFLSRSLARSSLPLSLSTVASSARTPPPPPPPPAAAAAAAAATARPPICRRLRASHRRTAPTAPRRCIGRQRGARWTRSCGCSALERRSTPSPR